MSERIAAPTDFLGVNLYSRQVVRRDPQRGVGYRPMPLTLPTTPMGYERAPHALGAFASWVSREYDGPIIYVTENGVCDNTEREGDEVLDEGQELGGILWRRSLRVAQEPVAQGGETPLTDFGFGISDASARLSTGCGILLGECAHHAQPAQRAL